MSERWLLSCSLLSTVSFPSAFGRTVLSCKEICFLFQGRVMNIFVMLPDPIIPLTTVIPQPAENAPLLSKAWTWHPYLPESAPGMMAQALLSTERWRPQEALLKTEEAKVRAGQWLWFQELQGLVEALPASAAHALAAWAVQRHMLLNVVPAPHKLSSGGLQLGPTQDSTRLQESPFA